MQGESWLELLTTFNNFSCAPPPPLPPPLRRAPPLSGFCFCAAYTILHPVFSRYFPRLYDASDGTYHCDLLRYYFAADAHLDAANGLLQARPPARMTNFDRF